MTEYGWQSLLLLLAHGLVSVALLGAITHQAVAVLRSDISSSRNPKRSKNVPSEGDLTNRVSSEEWVAVHQSAGRQASLGLGEFREFAARYSFVQGNPFTVVIIGLYLVAFVLGALLYPEYRTDSRYALEEMRLVSVVGLFELKEHWAALGLGILPLYWSSWRGSEGSTLRTRFTCTLAMIVWANFLVGHVVNNFRGV